MKVHLRRIPEQGSAHRLTLRGEALPRLAELLAPEGSTLEAELHLKRLGDGVAVRGRIEGTLRVPCHRCLEPMPVPVAEEVDLTLLPEARINALEDGLHLGERDLAVSFFSGDEVDLTHLVEDEALLLVPDVVCEEDEAGRCVCCGKEVAGMLGGDDAPLTDHPFTQMKRFLKD